eukprot:scaffold1060_cov196-Amphora_coffeaeformis.AAC.23
MLSQPVSAALPRQAQSRPVDLFQRQVFSATYLFPDDGKLIVSLEWKNCVIDEPPNENSEMADLVRLFLVQGYREVPAWMSMFFVGQNIDHSPSGLSNQMYTQRIINLGRSYWTTNLC